jgi:hypothetical protein
MVQGRSSPVSPTSRVAHRSTKALTIFGRIGCRGVTGLLRTVQEVVRLPSGMVLIW